MARTAQGLQVFGRIGAAPMERNYVIDVGRGTHSPVPLALDAQGPLTQ